MRPNQLLQNRQLKLGWWPLILTVGFGLLILFRQEVPPTAKDEPLSSVSPELAKTEQETIAPEDDAFLAEYDAKANSFFDASSDERPLWQVRGLLVLKLAFVIGLAYLAIAGLSWLQKSKIGIMTSESAIRILETTNLGPNQALHLIIIGEKTLLIGATEHQLCVLTELPDVALPLSDEDITFNELLNQQATPSQPSQGVPDTSTSIAVEKVLSNLQSNLRRIQEAVEGFQG
jgi:flagellar biogenesis protein FliO